MNKKRLTAYGLLLLTAALWGWAAPIVKYTLNFIDPIGFLFYRFWLVSFLFLPPFFIAVKKKPLPFKVFFRHFLIGLIGGPLTLLLIFFGADKTTSLNASLIVAMAPVFIVLAGVFFLKEVVTKKEQLGLALAVAGTLVTVVQPIANHHPSASAPLIGNLLLFTHNFVWTTYVILIKKESQKYSPLILTAITFFSGVFVLTPLFFLKTNLSPFQIPTPAIWGILYMSLFSSVIAYTTYNWGISLIEASEATLFTYLQPLFAAPLSFFWLKEKVSPLFLLGATLIAFGVFLTEYRSQRKKA